MAELSNFLSDQVQARELSLESWTSVFWTLNTRPDIIEQLQH